MDDNGNFGNLLIIGIILLLLIVVMTYILMPKNDSFALFSDEILGSKTIELYYSENNNGNASNYLINNMVGKSGFVKIVHNIDAKNSQINKNEEIDYRFSGNNDKVLNNYVNFNNEEYRIVGVFPVKNQYDNTEYRIKVIKTKKYTDSIYNNSSNNYNNSVIQNQLNTSFYNSLNDDSKKLIEYSTFYLGGYENANTLKNEMYLYERKYKNDENYNYFSKSHENTIKTIEYISLLYASDYAYASSCEERLNRLSIDQCKSNNWLYNGKNYWLLNQNSSIDGNKSFIVNSDGDVWTSAVNIPQTYVNNIYEIYPVFYLKANVNIKQGDGSKNNPYVFE